MTLDDILAMLEDKDISRAFEALKELEFISDQSGILYAYIDKFIDMIDSDKYVIRVRGFRLFCRQAKWDKEDIINKNIKGALKILYDEKPTAVRQALAALQCLVPYKKELHEIIKEHVLAIDYYQYKDTMHGLIKKDIEALLQVMEETQ